MRSSAILCRGAKGYGWYHKYLQKGPDGFRKNIPPTPFDWTKGDITRPKAFFEISMGDQKLGRLVFELASDIVPKTVENFLSLCNKKETSGQKYSYKDTKFHQILKDTFIMGGDVVSNDGRGSHSAGPTRFIKDENFIIPHSARGLLSMASIGRDTGGSQFYISLKPTSYMNGRCVVLGRMVEGDDVVKAVEKVFTFRGVPASDIMITDCGELKE
jgi:cyclophilin family peptidyl-prolyl cis-trans isomerase